MSQAFLQQLSRFLASRRPGWKVQMEENIFKIATTQFSVEWKVVEDMAAQMKCTIRDVQCVNGSILITVVMPMETAE